MKRVFGIALILCFLITVSITAIFGCEDNVRCPISQIIEIEKQLEFIATHNVDVETVKIYDLSELTEVILRNRVDTNTLIIERCIGRVVDDELNGEVLNYKDKDRYYINYKCVPNAQRGDLVLSYMIYNPMTNYEDDIVNRYDFIIQKGWLRNNGFYGW